MSALSVASADPNVRSPAPPGRVLIVEDDRLVALDLETMLVEFGFEPCATAASGDEALAAARNTLPDLTLMDIRLEGPMDGIEAALRLHTELGLRVVYLTANSDLSTVERAKLSDPYGYLLKPIRPLDLRCCLALALHQARLEQRERKAESERRLRVAAQDERTKRLDLLSAREVEVLTLVARGHTSKDIARALSIAKPTVDTYRSRLVEKLGVRSRTEIVSVASRAGLLEAPLAYPGTRARPDKP